MLKHNQVILYYVNLLFVNIFTHHFLFTLNPLTIYYTEAMSYIIDIVYKCSDLTCATSICYEQEPVILLGHSQ